MADTIDLAKVKRNVAKMVSMGAPEEDIDSYISSEGTSIDAIKNFKNSDNQKTIAKGDDFAQTIQPQNILGQLFNVPGAAIRSTIQGRGYVEGALNPDAVPKFQDMAIGAAQQSTNPAINAVFGMPASAVGLAADVATNPIDVLGSIIGKAPGAQQVGQSIASSKAGQVVGKFLNADIPNLLKYDTALQQAQKGKVALDTMRTTLGKAKQIALTNTGDIPAEVDFSGNLSQKVINAIKNPIYEVEFTPEGGVVGNVRNLDKIKTALNDLVTTKDFVEAGNMEKRKIMQFAGRIRDNMVNAADAAGKPELGKSLTDYHDFMANYNKINDHLVDKYGDAMANKLKAMFKPEAEQAVKESWKELSKTSPEINQIMKSMNKRELVRGLLKKAGYAGAAATALEATKKAVTGKF